jgi:4-amino-4-deoxy-L-arabinose transferase-like glycosyltransferase
MGFIAAAWQHRPRWPLDRQHQSLVLWGGWLLTGGAFFSVAGFFHPYYLATIAPPVAALAGIGVVSLWQDYRRGGWRSWGLPIVLIASVLVEAHILGYFPDWNRWLTPLVVGGSVVVALALILIRLKWRLNQSVALVATGLGVLALLLTPSIWSEYTVAHAAGGLVPSAGPGGRFGFGVGGPGFARGRRFTFAGGGSAGFPGGGPGFGPPGAGGFEGFRFPGDTRFRGAPGGRAGGFGGEGTTANPNLVRYLEAHQGHTRFLVATPNAGAAEPFILMTGRPVMALGGFMDDRILTVHQLASDVRNGTVRYFLLSGRGDRFGPRALPAQVRRYLERRGRFRGGISGRFGGPGGANNDLMQWVIKTCRVVPPSTYHTVSISAAGAFGGGEQLYDCGG